MDKGRITLGRGCVHGHPFSQFCVERAEGGWGGEGVVVTMALSRWRWASCIIWVRKLDVVVVRGEGGHGLLGKESVSYHCQFIVF